jgi:hypothetical protein
VLLHISTSVGATALRGLSPDAEATLLAVAWKLAVEHLPANTVGKRTSWRSFLFVLTCGREDALARAREILVELTQNWPVAHVPWRLVLTLVGEDYEQAFRLVQADAHDVIVARRDSVIAWVERFGSTLSVEFDQSHSNDPQDGHFRGSP